MKSFLSKIPENYQGKPVDLDESQSEDNFENALKCYDRAKKRLLNPPVWHFITGSLSATFKIDNPKVDNNERLLEENDFISINIHSPEAVLASNYDWVQVKEIYEEIISDEEEYFLLTLQVAQNPKTNETQIDHFFKEGASSSFVIHRKGKNVSALYFGRNETPNIEKENSTLKNVRNEIIALGAIAGASNLQWKALLKALLQSEL